MGTELKVDGLKEGKKFTVEQEFAILREYERRGSGVDIVKKYQAHPQTLYRLKKCLELGVMELLRGSRRKKGEEPR